MKRIIYISLPFLLFLSYGLFIGDYEISIFKNDMISAPPKGYFDYCGVTNIQSLASIGSGTFNEIVTSAQNSSLDFIILTDLNSFPPPMELEGYHSNLLVLTGGMYSFLDSRVLYYGFKEDYHFSDVASAHLFFTDALSQKKSSDRRNIVVFAHPLREKFGWVGSYPESLDGIEILNLQSMWDNAWQSSPLSFLWSVLIYPFNPRFALIRLFKNPDLELQLWDQLNRKQKVIGFSGSDAHAKAIPMKSVQWEFPSYQTSFDMVRNHVLLDSELTGHAINDKRKILKALKEGQFYMSLDVLSNAKGFFAVLKQGQNEIPMGSEVLLSDDLKIYVKLPQKPMVDFEIALIKNGEHIASTKSQELFEPIRTSGIYRIEVRVSPKLPIPDGKKTIPWIYSNPFFVKDHF